MSAYCKGLLLCLMATGVLMGVHLAFEEWAGLAEDATLALSLMSYYRYRSDIEHFVEAIEPLTSDGS